MLNADQKQTRKRKAHQRGDRLKKNEPDGCNGGPPVISRLIENSSRNSRWKPVT